MYQNSEKGSMSILGAFFIFVSILFLIFVLDYGSRVINSTGLQDVAESAALSGAKQLDNTQNGKLRAIDSINKLVVQSGYSTNDIKSIEFGNYINNSFTPNNSSVNVNAIKVNMNRSSTSPFLGFVGLNANVSLSAFSMAESKFQSNVISSADTSLQVNKQSILDYYGGVSCGMQVRVPIQDNSCHPVDLNFFQTNAQFTSQNLNIGKNLESSRFVSNQELVKFSSNLNPDLPTIVAVYDQVYDGYSYTMKNRVVGFTAFKITKTSTDFIYTLSCDSGNELNNVNNLQYSVTNSSNNFGATKQISLVRSRR